MDSFNCTLLLGNHGARACSAFKPYVRSYSILSSTNQSEYPVRWSRSELRHPTLGAELGPSTRGHAPYRDLNRTFLVGGIVFDSLGVWGGRSLSLSLISLTNRYIGISIVVPSTVTSVFDTETWPASRVRFRTVL